MSKKYFEDLMVGECYESSCYQVSLDEILSFSKQYDPLPMHSIEGNKSSTPIASGWLVCSIAMRQIVDCLLHDTEVSVSPGVENINWLRPLYPDDKVKTTITVFGKRESNSNSKLGIVTFKVSMINHKNQLIMEMAPKGFFRRKNFLQ